MTENSTLTTDEIALLASLIIKEPDHYAVLGVDRLASSEEIRNAYCIAVEYFHPLKRRNITDSDSVMHWKLSSAFVRIEEAFAILSNRSRREVYDENLSFQTERSLLSRMSARASDRVQSANEERSWPGRVRKSESSQSANSRPGQQGATAVAERRRVERVPLSVPLRVTLERQWQELTKTDDVSPLGIRFRLTRRVEPGSELRLEMPLPKHLRTHSHDDELYCCSAFVIYVSADNRNWLVVAELLS
jgi:curved DNA-binding protein CbpA